MTTFRRRRGGQRDRIYSYEFVYQGQRHVGSTGQLTKDAADAVERQLKDRARQQAHGVAIRSSEDSPLIQDWAETYYGIKKRRLTDPESLNYVLRGVLKFFGQTPEAGSKIEVDPRGKYHNLTLADIIERPRWIAEFEDWMYDIGLGAQTRNHFRSAMSDMFRVASEPQFREETGVIQNPFAGLARDRLTRRTSTVTPVQLRAWIAAASLHARVAVAIGGLASKLRLRNILNLEWRHISADTREIVVERHKTASRIGRPIIVAIEEPLRSILKQLRDSAPKDATHVITYRGKPVKSIRHSIKSAAIEAGLIYGRTTDAGITFHSLRHTAATILKRKKVPADVRKDVMGHSNIAMTEWYEHVDVSPQRPAVRQLAAALALTPASVLGGPAKMGKRTNPAARRGAVRQAPAAAKSQPKSHPFARKARADDVRKKAVNS
jgi:integrase